MKNLRLCHYMLGEIIVGVSAFTHTCAVLPWNPVRTMGSIISHIIVLVVYFGIPTLSA